MSKIITPKCCKDAQYFGTVHLSLNVYSGDSSTKKPAWVMVELDTNAFFYLHPTMAMRDRVWQSEPKFCPYCGTALPEIRPRAKPYKNVCKVTDGGYYCDTCEERLSSCKCHPPECAWEVVGND